MGAYYISSLVISGAVFKSEEALGLEQAIKLARELNLRGYVFHIDEKVGGRYEHKDLSELEKLLEKRKGR